MKRGRAVSPAVGLILDAIGGDSLKKKLSATRVERQARDIWRFVGCHRHDGRDTRIHARERALASGNPLSLMNGNKGRFGVQHGHVNVIRLQGDTGSDESGISAILCDLVSPTMKV